MTLNKNNLLRAAGILGAGIAISWLIIVAKPEPEHAPHREAPPHIADVVNVELVSQPITVTSQGTVTPKTAIDITSQVSGQVVAVSDHFAAGGFFSAGEPLLTIDPRDYEIALAKAQATLAEAQKALAQEQGQSLQAKREWRELGNKAANDLFLRKPQLAAAKANVQAAEAGVRQARLNLERTAIAVPFAGRVLTVAANLGQYIAAGTKVGRVYAADTMEVRLPLSAEELQLLNIKLDAAHAELKPMAVSLHLPVANQTLSWTGQVVRIESAADEQSRLFHVVAEISMASQATSTHALSKQAASQKATSQQGEADKGDQNKADTSEQAPHQAPPPPLVPGMFVAADILSNPYTDIAVLPRSALFESAKVLILDDDNRLQAHPVDVLQIDTRQLIVRGLAPGARVVVKPPSLIELDAVYQPRLAPTEGGA